MTQTRLAPHPAVQLARRWVVDYFNSQDVAAAREFIAPEYALEIGDHLFDGRDTQWLPAVAQQFAQFPGMGMTVHQVVAGSGSKEGHVAVCFSEHGASGGPGGPTAVWSGVGIYRAERERLVGCCAQEDYATRSRQLRSACQRHWGRAGIGVRRHSHSGTANSAPVAKRRKVTCVVP